MDTQSLHPKLTPKYTDQDDSLSVNIIWKYFTQFKMEVNMAPNPGDTR